jgi:hypothetical protein
MNEFASHAGPPDGTEKAVSCFDYTPLPVTLCMLNASSTVVRLKLTVSLPTLPNMLELYAIFAPVSLLCLSVAVGHSSMHMRTVHLFPVVLLGTVWSQLHHLPAGWGGVSNRVQREGSRRICSSWKGIHCGFVFLAFFV